MSRRHPIAVATLAIITATVSVCGVAPFALQPSYGATLAERMSGFKNIFKEKESSKQREGRQQSSTPSTRLGRPSYRHTDHAQRSRPSRNQQVQSQNRKPSKTTLSKYLSKKFFGSKQQQNQTAQKTKQPNREQQSKSLGQASNQQQSTPNRNQPSQKQLTKSRSNSSRPRTINTTPTQRPAIDNGEVIAESLPSGPENKSLDAASIRKSPRIARRDDVQEALSDLQDSDSIMPGSVVIDSETVVVEEDSGSGSHQSTAIAMDDYGIELPSNKAEPEVEVAETVPELDAETLPMHESVDTIVETAEPVTLPEEVDATEEGKLEILGRVPLESPSSAEEGVETETLQIPETLQAEVEPSDTETQEVAVAQESVEQAETEQLDEASVPFGDSEMDIHEALLSEELYEHQSVDHGSVSAVTEEPQQLAEETQPPIEELLEVESALVDTSETAIEEEVPADLFSEEASSEEPAPETQSRGFAVQEIDIDALNETIAEEADDSSEKEVAPERDIVVSDARDSSNWNAAAEISDNSGTEQAPSSINDSLPDVSSEVISKGKLPGPEFFDEVIQQPREEQESPTLSRQQEEELSTPIADTNPPSKNREVTRLVRPRGDVLTTVEQPVIRSHVEGPRSILVGKEASYRVVLENTSQTTAANLSATVKVPEWAELVDVICSSGLVEQVRNADNSDSLQWTLPKLAAHSSQTMQLQLVPRSGRAFQLGVQWKQQPTKAETTVQVQEPKLALKLNGPEEVFYGEARRYQLILENPGNAPAENVAISLIPPGSDSESASTHVLGTLHPQEVKEMELELTAREAGEMVLHAFATAKNDLRADVVKRVKCQKPELQVDWRGPDEKYAGTETAYYIRVQNPGSAPTTDVEVKIQLPKGINFLSASDSFSFDARSGLVVWKLDQLKPKEEQFMQVRCELDLPGIKQFTVEASAVDGLVRDRKTIRTDVVALADLKLEVRDPRGAQPTGEPVTYEIRVENRGSTDAEGISIVGLFSQGIDPVSIEGAESSVKDGRVNFQAIKSLPPGGEVVLHIRAVASEVGMHIFRAEVSCQDLDIKLAAEETTRFFEDNFGWNEGDKPFTALRTDETIRR